MRQQRSLINGPELPPPNLNAANIFYGRFGVKLPNLKTAKLYGMEEDGGSPTTTGLLGSGLQQNLVFSSCSPNFAADVFGATNYFNTQCFDQGSLLRVYKIVAFRHVFIGG